MLVRLIIAGLIFCVTALSAYRLGVAPWCHSVQPRQRCPTASFLFGQWELGGEVFETGWPFPVKSGPLASILWLVADRDCLVIQGPSTQGGDAGHLILLGRGRIWRCSSRHRSRGNRGWCGVIISSQGLPCSSRYCKVRIIDIIRIGQDTCNIRLVCFARTTYAIYTVTGTTQEPSLPQVSCYIFLHFCRRQIV